MVKKVACRSCGFKAKADDQPETCPKCGGDDWKKVYKARQPKNGAEAVAKPAKKKAAADKKPAAKPAKRQKRARQVDAILEKRFAVMARAVSDTLPHIPDDVFVSMGEDGSLGFSSQPPTVNDTAYLIPLPFVNEVIYTWLTEQPGTWTFEVIEPQLTRSIKALSFTQAITTDDPILHGEDIRSVEKLKEPEDSAEPVIDDSEYGDDDSGFDSVASA